jgi:hypothetical protein
MFSVSWVMFAALSELQPKDGRLMLQGLPLLQGSADTQAVDIPFKKLVILIVPHKRMRVLISVRDPHTHTRVCVLKAKCV